MKHNTVVEDVTIVSSRKTDKFDVLMCKQRKY